MITNFQAQLTHRDLLLGHTTKGDIDTMVGSHGEGLKIAALILQRNGYRMEIAANNYHWTFGLQGRDTR